MYHENYQRGNVNGYTSSNAKSGPRTNAFVLDCCIEGQDLATMKRRMRSVLPQTNLANTLNLLPTSYSLIRSERELTYELFEPCIE